MNNSDTPLLVAPDEAAKDLWNQVSLDKRALPFLEITGAEPILPSSFVVATAATASIATAGLAAAEIRRLRGHTRQQVSVDMRHAAQECATYFTVNGAAPQVWDKVSGIYPCGENGQGGFVRIHANFAHHRDGVLDLLGCQSGARTERAEVLAALKSWTALDFEDAASRRGLVVAALRTFEEWEAHPQGSAVAAQSLIRIEKIGDAAPRSLSKVRAEQLPLTGLRVLDLTRILAGPVGTRALAGYGADVMLVSSPDLPNVGLAETSRGKLSVHLDLLTVRGRETLIELVRTCHFFAQGYRPGGIARLGFGPREVAQLRPGVVYGSLSAYGSTGPWAERRGFDSLVQTAMGFNHAEGVASGTGQPKALPIQILDHATGYLLALGMQSALARQLSEGGSWHVQVSLARTGAWLRSLGRVNGGLLCPMPPIDDLLEESDSGFGKLVAVGHSVRFADTPARLRRPSVPPGTDPACWPQ